MAHHIGSLTHPNNHHDMLSFWLTFQITVNFYQLKCKNFLTATIQCVIASSLSSLTMWWTYTECFFLYEVLPFCHQGHTQVFCSGFEMKNTQILSKLLVSVFIFQWFAHSKYSSCVSHICPLMFYVNNSINISLEASNVTHKYTCIMNIYINLLDNILSILHLAAIFLDKFNFVLCCFGL